jgi:hypothetical protein
MRWRSVALPLSLLLALPGGVRAQDEAAIQAAEEIEAINAELDSLAREIAGLLSHPGFRGQLRGQINGSQHKEHIIELEGFLAAAASRPNMPPGLAKASENAKGLADRLGRPEGLPNGLDIYFPVQDHRDKWRGNEDLLVAYSPAGEEVGPVVAYSVRSGERMVLSAESPPETPVLVVVQEEHASHEQDEVAEEDGVPVIVDAPPGEGLLPDYLSASYIKIYNDREPWTRGDPEVYLLIGHTCGGQARSYYRDLARVNSENRWYWTQDLNAMPFSGSCSNETYFAIWERDGSCSRRFGGTSSACSYDWPRIMCYPDGGCSYKYLQMGRNSGDDFIYASTGPANVVNKAAVPYNQHWEHWRYAVSGWGAVRWHKWR